MKHPNERNGKVFMSEKECFIRQEGNPWERGEPHHERALTAYLALSTGKGVVIGANVAVPHDTKGTFKAYFAPVADHVYQFQDSKGHVYEIMMETPSRVTYINRVMDLE